MDAFRGTIVSALGNDHFFSDIKVLHERLGDLDYQIRLSLAGLEVQGGSLGICAIVMTTGGSVKSQNMKGPVLDPMNIKVRIMENVLLNMGAQGTKKPASLVAEVVAIILHHLMVPGYHECINVSRIGLVPIPNFLAYDVDATTSLKLIRQEE